MKRIASLILAIIILVTLFGCGKDTPEYEVPAEFYYIQREITYNSSSGVICPELADIAQYQTDLVKLLNTYLSGPVSQELVSPFPSNTRLIACDVIRKEAHLTLTKEFLQLTGVRLSTACSCMALTVAGISPIEKVHFRVEDSLIDGREFLTVTVADIIMLDDAGQKG